MGIALPILFLIRAKFHRSKVYKYPLASFLKLAGFGNRSLKGPILFALRATILALAAILVSRPLWVDHVSNVKVDGIDVVLALDMSNSMELLDDPNDPRTRIQVARKEAVNFIKRRLDDQISVVVFGAQSTTMAPLTLDKKMLEEVVSRLKIGDVDPMATNLSEGLALSAVRLKDSKAKSKIIILLTDGHPTGSTQVSMERAIQLAKDLEARVYTIGVGSAHGGYLAVAPGYYQRAMDAGVDFELLEKISKATGGKTFCAQNPKEMEEAYKQIDLLEKTERQSSEYYSYRDIFWPIVTVILAFMFLEVFLASWLWRSVW